MKNNYLINIEGQIEADGEKDTVCLMTRGNFTQNGGKFFISYEETEATGYDGNITTVKVEKGDKISMLRHGTMPSSIVIEPGRRHVCHYDTGYGVMSLGVSADEVDNRLTRAGGNLTFSYTLDSGNASISHNTVKITVQEAH